MDAVGEKGSGGMMGDDQETAMPMMPQMMMKMMPQCLTMMLPNIAKEKRVAFVSKMVATLVGEGVAGMSEEEKKSFQEELLEIIMG